MLKPQTEDLTGKKFGRLTVVSFAGYLGKKNYTQAHWNCICECDNSCCITSSRLKIGTTKSCGCFKKETSIINGKNRKGAQYRVPDENVAANGMFRSYMYNAKISRIDFSLTVEECIKLFKGNCYYCGIEPIQVRQFAGHKERFIHNGIARLDMNKGYVLDNCVSCCKTCNYKKLHEYRREKSKKKIAS